MSPRPDSTEPDAPRPMRVGGVTMWVVRNGDSGTVYGPFPSKEAGHAWAVAHGIDWYRVTELLDPED